MSNHRAGFVLIASAILALSGAVLLSVFNIGDEQGVPSARRTMHNSSTVKIEVEP